MCVCAQAIGPGTIRRFGIVPMVGWIEEMMVEQTYLPFRYVCAMCVCVMYVSN